MITKRQLLNDFVFVFFKKKNSPIKWNKETRTFGARVAARYLTFDVSSLSPTSRLLCQRDNLA